MQAEIEKKKDPVPNKGILRIKINVECRDKDGNLKWVDTAEIGADEAQKLIPKLETNDGK